MRKVFFLMLKRNHIKSKKKKKKTHKSTTEFVLYWPSTPGAWRLPLGVVFPVESTGETDFSFAKWLSIGNSFLVRDRS